MQKTILKNEFDYGEFTVSLKSLSLVEDGYKLDLSVIFDDSILDIDGLVISTADFLRAILRLDELD